MATRPRDVTWTRTPGRRAARSLLALALLAAGCRDAPDAAPPVVRIAAAASLTDVLGTLCGRFEQEKGVRCETSFGSSSVLARQIEQGMAADVFLSANPEWARQLDDRRLLAPGSMAPFAHNALVVVVPAASGLAIGGLADLVSPRVARVALGDPSHVPAGVYARKALERAGLWDGVQGKVVGAVDVRAALAMVERGAVDCGMVYATDARVSHGVRVAWRVPEDAAPRVTLVEGVVAGPRSDVRAGRAFAGFLASPEARKVFADQGFEP